jgi:N-acetylglucosaminyltransferase
MLNVAFGDWLTVWPIGLAFVLSWSIWLYRRTLSQRAVPLVSLFSSTTSIVVPVFREDVEILKQCLRTWVAECPDEIILVVDIADQERLRMLNDEELDGRVRVIWFKHSGKRSALAVGVRAAAGEIVVLVDSDTAWSPGLLTHIVMPFENPRVGGVGSRQVVAARESSVWRKVASWMLDVRYRDYVPALGAHGGVPCLSGRTAAYRRSVILPKLPQLEHEYFLGRLCVAGDDGRLTWLVLGAGYQTVYQASAVAVSMFPDNGRAFIKQRIRWSRNSFRCYLTAIFTGSLWRQPFITQLTIMQILMTPLTMGLAITYLFSGFVHHPWFIVLAGLILLFIGRGIRGISHLKEQPGDLVILPLIVLMTIVVALPLKIFAFFTMNRQGWLTRHQDLVGGEGQTFLPRDGFFDPPRVSTHAKT